MFNHIRKLIAIIVLTAFIGTSVQSSVYAQMAVENKAPWMPNPGSRLALSPDFNPSILKGITIHPENPLMFDFLIFKGDKVLSNHEKQDEYKRLIKYFLASLAIPDEHQWVNLSPYEKNRIIKDDFGKTLMGRDLLAQDYILKQLTASLIYPEEELGKKFWDNVYAKAKEQFGTTNIPVSTFNKVWIVPDQALIYEKGNTAYVLKNHLKVMLEEDYLALNNNMCRGDACHRPQTTSAIGSQIIRNIIIPALEKEVNEGKNFAPLRQVYSGMILAAWFKRVLKESLLGKIYADKAKVLGVNQNPQNNKAIYQRYLKAYKKGVFNYIKEDVDRLTNKAMPRKYFSGGATQAYNKEGVGHLELTNNAMIGDATMRTDVNNLESVSAAMNSAGHTRRDIGRIIAIVVSKNLIAQQSSPPTTKIPQSPIIPLQVRQLGGRQISTPQDYRDAKDVFNRLLNEKIGGDPFEKVLESNRQGVDQRKIWMSNPEFANWRDNLFVERVGGVMQGISYAKPEDFSLRQPLLKFIYPGNLSNRVTYTKEGYGVYRYSRGFIVATPYGTSSIIPTSAGVVSELLPAVPKSEPAYWQQAFRDPETSLQQSAEYVNRPFGRNVLVVAAYGAPSLAVEQVLNGNQVLRRALEAKDKYEDYARHTHHLLEIINSEYSLFLKKRMALLWSEMFFSGMPLNDDYKAIILSGGNEAIRQQLKEEGLTVKVAAAIAEDDILLANALREIIEEYQKREDPPYIGWPTIEAARMALVQKLGFQPSIRAFDFEGRRTLFTSSQTDPNTWGLRIQSEERVTLGPQIQAFVQFDSFNGSPLTGETEITMMVKGQDTANQRPVERIVKGKLSKDGVITISMDANVILESINFSISSPLATEDSMRWPNIQHILLRNSEPVPQPLPMPNSSTPNKAMTADAAMLLKRTTKSITLAIKNREFDSEGFADKAQASDFGGIDFNSANLAMMIKRDGKGVVLPLARQDLAQLGNIEGLDPFIISIKPASQTPLFSQLLTSP